MNISDMIVVVKTFDDENQIKNVTFEGTNGYTIDGGVLQIVYADHCAHVYAPDQWLEISCTPKKDS